MTPMLLALISTGCIPAPLPEAPAESFYEGQQDAFGPGTRVNDIALDCVEIEGRPRLRVTVDVAGWTGNESEVHLWGPAAPDTGDRHHERHELCTTWVGYDDQGRWIETLEAVLVPDADA